MTIHIEWDNAERTIVRAEFNDPYTWDEYDAASSKIRDMVTGVSHRVDMITLLNPKISQPPGNGFPHYRRTMLQMPPNFGLFVSVGAGNPVARMIMSTLIKVLRMKTPSAFANSLEDARALIAQCRAAESAQAAVVGNS